MNDSVNWKVIKKRYEYASDFSFILNLKGVTHIGTHGERKTVNTAV